MGSLQLCQFCHCFSYNKRNNNLHVISWKWLVVTKTEHWRIPFKITTLLRIYTVLFLCLCMYMYCNSANLLFNKALTGTSVPVIVIVKKGGFIILLLYSWPKKFKYIHWELNAVPKKKVLRLQEAIVQENLCVFNTVTKQNKCALWVSVLLKS